jgi:hypothetical protein
MMNVGTFGPPKLVNPERSSALKQRAQTQVPAMTYDKGEMAVAPPVEHCLVAVWFKIFRNRGVVLI